ncbi:MAG: cytochrome D1 domain-containing protein, partial [Alphaproteobacteria bacterium]
MKKTRTSYALGTPLVAVALVLLGSGVGGVQAGEVWVANMKGANVQVIDTDSLATIATIPTGKGAHNVTISPDGNLAFVANVGDGTVSIIDADAKKVLGTVPGGTKPHDVAVSPDGKLAVSCNVGSGDITFIDVGAKKAVHTM